MAEFSLHQVDVFTSVPLKGNPLAVVLGADPLSDEQMAALANWTNLSETAFLLRPTHPDADYRLRIFTPHQELPFAGHPTIGACYVWLANGGQPKGEEIMQQCGIGSVRLRRQGSRLAFAAPTTEQRPAARETITQIAAALGIPPSDIIAAQHVSASPPWVAIMLSNRDQVLALRPDYPAMGTMEIGVVAPTTGDADFEVRAFAPADGIPEDPVTGSLNAGLARWLISAGLAPSHYVVAQGTCLGRAGRVYVEHSGRDFWIGGDVTPCITGTIKL